MRLRVGQRRRRLLGPHGAPTLGHCLGAEIAQRHQLLPVALIKIVALLVILSAVLALLLGRLGAAEELAQAGAHLAVQLVAKSKRSAFFIAPAPSAGHD